MTLETVRPARLTQRPPGGVLLVHAHGAAATSLVEALREGGETVDVAGDGNEAVERIVRHRFDALVLDGELAGAPSHELLNVIRAYDGELPIIVMTRDASGWGGKGVKVLMRPLEMTSLLGSLVLGRSRRKSKQDKTSIEIASVRPVVGRERVEELFDRALDGLWMAFQPIVEADAKPAFAYEALLRSHEPRMSTPAEVLSAAEELGRLDEVGQRVRSLAASAFPRAPDDALLFLNVHSRDLLDPGLYDANAPLASLAPRVVLEITERAPLDQIQDVGRRLSILRFNGFRVAVDDLGAGHAGLGSFATVEPEFVKLDMTLVRHLESSPTQRQLVRSLLETCHALDTRVIAEGVETEEELLALRELGCELFQGFYFARPSDSFELPARRASLR